MGHFKELRFDRAEKRRQKKAEAPDDLGDALAIVWEWMENYRENHDDAKPPTLTFGAYNSSMYLTVSLKDQRRSCTGWGETLGGALTQLEGKLADQDNFLKHFKPWQDRAGG